ncbi:serine hydrolase [Mucilaginibacter jinjuensis]|uniref:Serine hydrolase n=1 Tax=Mucilaginibacter jinjuensis TaxID=1176721 RepID=A0ABY7T9L3_9SPHI|nr:serine hydrolase [Mucilaginibacter jinjuensis]WCT12606.1 serine hydrolase [Mucilaginibacter jinjuensis]
MRRYFTCLFLFIFPVFSMAQSAEQLAAFDQYVQKGVTDWQVPGLAIIVVKNNQVVFKKGYGVLEKGKTDKVNTQTMFAIASTTKAITATCAGILVDEGKLHWDDKVTDYLPDFQLYDPYVTRELTVRDLFLHDSGVGNTDYLWGLMDISSDEIMHRLRLVKPQYSFRAGFAYQNIFYLVAGKVIEKAGGMPWDQFIKTRIFEPLKMIRTVPLIKYTKGLGNLSSAHMKIDSVVQKVPLDETDEIGPAGGVWSCVDDMGKWVQCMLDSSKYDHNKRLLKPETWAYLLEPHTFVTKEEFYPTMQLTHPHWITYGMGWFQQDYKGQKVDFHTGSLSGMIAINGMLVDKQMGVYILANLDHAELRHALMFKAFDTFALGGDTDWSADFLKLYNGIHAKQEKAEKDELAKRVMGTKPSLELSNYAGKYTDPLYGEVNVKADKDALVIDINHILTATVKHWHYDTFYGDYSNIAYGKAAISFNLNPEDGKVNSISVDGLVLNRAN